MERARMRKARNLILPGLALFFLTVPTSQAGHLFPESPAGISYTASPDAVDTAAVRGVATRSSTGPNDVPAGLVGWTGGDAVAFQAKVVSGLFRAFGSATQPEAFIRGVETHAGGNATIHDAIVQALFANAVGSATGDGALVEGIRAAASGNADGADSAIRGATIMTGRPPLSLGGPPEGGNAIGLGSVVQTVRVRAFGNAVGANSTVRGVDVTMEGLATGSGAEIRAIRALTTGASGAAVAVHARTSSTIGRAVDARAVATSGSTVGVRGQVDSPQGIGVHGLAAANSNGLAGKFEGRVQIDCPSHPCLTVRGHNVGDLAENMVAIGRTEPGDVVILAQGRDTKWGVARATRPYDTRVAGIVSTQPRILLQVYDQNTVPVAMVGIVSAKATASNGSIRVGDLLTTSSIPGRLMRCSTPGRCIGAIVAKALEPLRGGTGTILVLVWRQ